MAPTIEFTHRRDFANLLLLKHRLSSDAFDLIANFLPTECSVCFSRTFIHSNTKIWHFDGVMLQNELFGNIEQEDEGMEYEPIFFGEAVPFFRQHGVEPLFIGQTILYGRTPASTIVADNKAWMPVPYNYCVRHFVGELFDYCRRNYFRHFRQHDFVDLVLSHQMTQFRFTIFIEDIFDWDAYNMRNKTAVLDMHDVNRVFPRNSMNVHFTQLENRMLCIELELYEPPYAWHDSLEAE